MKKKYFPPKAELICFVPAERLAGWTSGDNTWKFFNHWGSLGTRTNNNTQTVSGVMNWYDETSKIYDLD